jgi:hypothetical protein
MLPPISSNLSLSIREIAEHWSREIRPPASPREIREEMTRSWWRGELPITGGSQAIEVLRSLHGAGHRYAVVFVGEGHEPPPISMPLDDGGVEVDVRVRLPVPNGNPDTWNEDNCREALEALASNWRETAFEPLASALTVAITLTPGQFFGWVDKHEFDRPVFWREPRDDSAKPKDRRHFNAKSAARFVADYIEKEKSAGRVPTQSGLEAAKKAAGYPPGGRTLLRAEFKKRKGGILKRGHPPKNSPAEK